MNRTLARPWIPTALAALHLALAVWAVLCLSPRAPYADTWAFDARLLDEPFPRSVLSVTNGHAQIPSHWLRWLELTFWHGTPWPTILAGLALLLLAVALWCTVRWSHPQALDGGPPPASVRANWALCGIVGLCWLGNARTLTHGNEALHAYLVIACLLAALRLAAFPGYGRLAAALALAVLASLSFATGLAVFPAIAVVLWLRRARWTAWSGLAAVALASVAVHTALPGPNGSALDWQPGLQAAQAVRWLAGPWLWAGGPFVDAELASQVPAVLRPLTTALASASHALFGPARTAVWPQFGLGMAGLIALAWLTVQARWQPGRWPMPERLALGLAWFAVACGLLIVLARSDYFLRLPGEIYAPRYAVWYSLFWCGLVAALLCRLAERLRVRMAQGLVVVIALGLLPSSVWTGLSTHIRTLAANDALALRYGIIDAQAEHGENPVPDMIRARAAMLSAGTALFAPASGPLPGTRVPAPAAGHALDNVHWQRVHNLMPGPAARVRFAQPGVTGQRLWLLDASGEVVGEARRVVGGDSWQGWVQAEQGPLTAFVP